jgi:3-hydroxyisobutyrate dehydrogenase
VENVLLGEGRALGAMRPGSTLSDMSTISPAFTRQLARRCAEKGIDVLDAPVTGGDLGAIKGSLSIMVGGEREVLERCRPVLEALGDKITHVGPSGSGQVVKLVNQIIGVGNTLAMAEGLLFARRAGVDPETALRAIEDGAAGSWMLTHRGPQILADDWKPGFTVELQQKDIRLALEAADACGTPLLAAKTAHSLYQALLNRGLGGDGNHALIKAVEFLSGDRSD